MMSYEVEQKFYVDDRQLLQQRLADLGAQSGPPEQHSDTYYNHPCRDFSETQEALRIRRVNGSPHITYKGRKLPGAVKARRELEWLLSPGDPDGEKTAELWGLLGFRVVATVSKIRLNYRFSGDLAPFCVMIDEVDPLGTFAEIEGVVDSEQDVEAARARIMELAAELRLSRGESRSYLRMFLGLDDSE